jgi:hypothetical protein
MVLTRQVMALLAKLVPQIAPQAHPSIAHCLNQWADWGVIWRGRVTPYQEIGSCGAAWLA